MKKENKKKRNTKKTVGILLLVVVCVVLFLRLFPVVFWKCHAIATKALRVKPVEGQTDLEYAYGQDQKEEVTYLETEEGYTIMYPSSLENSNEKLPVVVWANGTGNGYTNYEAALKSLASYGFVVAGCDDTNMGDGSKLLEMAEFLMAQNKEKTSPLYGHLDTEHMGAAGHSQGACGAVNAVTKYENSDMFKSLFTTSLPKLSMCVDKKGMEFAYWNYDMSKISIPYFGNTGTRFLDGLWISPLSAMEENFAALPDHIEAYAARRIGANHNIVNKYHGCGYLNAWFCYTLKGDEEAAKVFTGEDPELFRNSKRWKDVMSK